MSAARGPGSAARVRAGAAGVLAVDKPEGPTSHDIVAKARRALGERRIGHTGTLDPFASGLLLLCVGRATRLAEYLTAQPKTYRVTARLGIATATDDATGEVTGEPGAWQALDRTAVLAALRSLGGRQLQVPPAFSAKKLGGERAYERARRGEPVEQRAVPVEVFRIEPVRLELPLLAFEVECSSGTYVRALARDLGERLGCGAHLTALRRTRIGSFTVEAAAAADRLADPAALDAAWLTPLEAVGHLPRLDVDDADARILARGGWVPAPPGTPESAAVAIAHAGELLAVATAGDGRVRPRKVLLDG